MSATENNGLPFDVNAYYNYLSQLESRGKGDYEAKNRLGYLGRYQMGAKALADIGWVKPGTTNKGLLNRDNWLVGDHKEFLSSPELQDNAARQMLEKNYGRAVKSGIITPNMAPHEQAGHMAGIHLVGHKGYKKSLAGEDVRDANKMSPTEYYNYISERLMPSVTYEEPKPVQQQQEQPWWANPLEAGKNYLKGLF